MVKGNPVMKLIRGKDTKPHTRVCGVKSVHSNLLPRLLVVCYFKLFPTQCKSVVEDYSFIHKIPKYVKWKFVNFYHKNLSLFSVHCLAWVGPLLKSPVLLCKEGWGERERGEEAETVKSAVT